VVQSKNSGVPDEILGELALKIEAELPEEIVCYVTFGHDAEAKNLVVDWSVQLSTEDLKLLTDVVTGYGGCYTNLKDDYGKDRGCFLVPRNQPPPAFPAETQTPKREEPQKSSEGASKVPSVAGQEIKQQSPLTLFQGKYCSSCSDQATCTPRTAAGRQRLAICFKVMELQVFDFIAERLHKLCQIQEDNGKSLLQIQPQGTPSTHSSNAQPSSEAKHPEPSHQPTPMPVQRSTRPEQGHIDQGIVWTNEVGSRGQYEKATEKDNGDREAYFQLHDWLSENEKPFKEGYFYWIFDQGAPAIGRKKTKPNKGRS
jgi:hypothetical protein